MKKLLISLFIALQLFQTSTIENVYANDDIEVIEEEETPLASPKKSNDYLLVTSAGIFFVAACYYMYEKKNGLKLYASNIQANEDGSYIIKLGYSSKKDMHAENKLEVKKGSMIILDQKLNENIEAGKHDDVITAIVNDKTELSWQVNGNEFTLDEESLRKSN